MVEKFRNWIDRLRDPERSPLPTLPWVAQMVSQGAPTEMLLNTTGALLMGLMPPLTVLLLQRVVDTVVAGAGEATAEVLLPPLLALAGAMILGEVGGAMQPATNNRIIETMARRVLHQVAAKAARLSLAQFDDAATHDLIERAAEAQGRRLAIQWNRLQWLGLQGIRVAGAALIVGATSVPLALVACVAAVPVAWAGVRQGGRLFRMHRNQTQARRKATYLAGLLTGRQGATEVRSYGLAGHFLGRWRDLFRQQRDEMLQTRLKGVREGLLADLSVTALYAVTLGGVAYLSGARGLTPGEIVAIARSVQILQGSSTHFAQVLGEFWENGLPLVHLRRFLALSEGERPGEQGRPFPGGTIRFEGVTFRYPGKAEPVVDNVSLTIHTGEKIALVGPNGAGKSTLVKLLLGLYQPTEGRITVGGVDLAAIAPDSLRAHVSAVFQEFARFDMTVAENIAIGRSGAGRDAVERAGQAAGLDFIRDLPQGYDTMLGRTFTGGTDLSGGQWQRIALARAFVRGADVIMLDEPTAALDARAELDLFGKFVDLAAGKTALLISHRLGSARLADRVVVLDRGRIVEQGAHGELVQQGGLYAGLFQAQAQWYEESAAVKEAVV